MADRQKYLDFLNQILITPSLETWDPMNFAAKLCIDDVITAGEMERLRKLPGRDERKLVSTQSGILSMFKNAFIFEFYSFSSAKS